MYEKELYDVLIEEGADLAGFCCLKDVKNAPFPYAVSVAYKLSDSVLKTIDGAPSKMYFQHYRTVNTKLDLIALRAVKFIEQKGFQAFPVAASQSVSGRYYGYFPHKTAAVLSGLGYVGRNCLLITPEYGSKVRLATVLTDMPLEPQRKQAEFACKECRACVSACPAGAISGLTPSPSGAREDFFDAEKCSEFMKTFKDVGRGAVCGLCIKACPKNKL